MLFYIILLVTVNSVLLQLAKKYEVSNFALSNEKSCIQSKEALYNISDQLCRLRFFFKTKKTKHFYVITCPRFSPSCIKIYLPYNNSKHLDRWNFQLQFTEQIASGQWCLIFTDVLPRHKKLYHRRPNFKSYSLGAVCSMSHISSGTIAWVFLVQGVTVA